MIPMYHIDRIDPHLHGEDARRVAHELVAHAVERAAPARVRVAALQLSLLDRAQQRAHARGGLRDALHADGRRLPKSCIKQS